MRDVKWVGTRWLGVGLASVLAVVTLGLAATGRLGLYINPDSTWFAVSMSVLVLVGAVASFALPLGAEADHGHDHGDAPDHAHTHAGGNDHAGSRHAGHQLLRNSHNPPDSTGWTRNRRESEEFGHHHGDVPDHAHTHDPVPHELTHPQRVGRVERAAVLAGGAVASAVVVLTLVLPPSSLSAELAMSRDVGGTPLFAGQDAVTLAATGDTSAFGVGEWATVFATTTSPEAFDGDPIELTGFVTPGEEGQFDLTRLVITHCVIDAQPASLPVTAASGDPGTGQWVKVSGTVRSTSDGRLQIDAASVEEIPEPQDPYEY